MIFFEKKFPPLTRLSVNINKIALLRNSRGGNVPDLVQFAQDCERFGAEGITVHPRPDERHIRYADIPALRAVVRTEFNIEGNPEPAFIDLVLQNKPDQVTLVPDAVGQLTSDHGWDTVGQQSYLREIVGRFKAAGIRVSLFVDPEVSMVEGAALTGADRIELYTGPYAEAFARGRQAAVRPYVKAAEAANAVGLGLNAGHDLNLDNLAYFQRAMRHIPLLEVSIGHALVRDALYYGIQRTIQLYQNQLR